MQIRKKLCSVMCMGASIEVQKCNLTESAIEECKSNKLNRIGNRIKIVDNKNIRIIQSIYLCSRARFELHIGQKRRVGHLFGNTRQL